MIVGKVVGSVVSTRKSEKLIGQKFMIVEPVHHMKSELSQIVAIDIIGAGIGEYVLVAQGSAARIGCGEETAPIDAAIVGIIDDGAGLSNAMEIKELQKIMQEGGVVGRRRRIPHLCKAYRQGGHDSHELCGVRTSAETAQTAAGKTCI